MAPGADAGTVVGDAGGGGFRCVGSALPFLVAFDAPFPGPAGRVDLGVPHTAFDASARLPRPDPAPFTLGQPTPHTEPDVVLDGVVQALLSDGAAGADSSGSVEGLAAFGEEQVGVVGAAGAVGLPRREVEEPHDTSPNNWP